MSHKLLLVDDDAIVLNALARTLRRFGYDVRGVPDGKSALAHLEREPVDLLISDLDMPGMRGTELVAEVRRRHPEVVRVLLTGAATLDSALDAINAGEVHRYLTKPWDDDELARTVADALARLDELRRSAAAERAAGRRERLLADLEAEHPGIRHVERQGGAYVLDVPRLETLSRRLSLGLVAG